MRACEREREGGGGGGKRAAKMTETRDIWEESGLGQSAHHSPCIPVSFKDFCHLWDPRFASILTIVIGF